MLNNENLKAEYIKDFDLFLLGFERSLNIVRVKDKLGNAGSAYVENGLPILPKYSFNAPLAKGERLLEMRRQGFVKLAEFDRKMAELEKSGVANFYTIAARQILVDRFNHVSEDTHPVILVSGAISYFSSALEDGILDGDDSVKRAQYNVKTGLDLFCASLEHYLGFVREFDPNSKNKKGIKLEVIQNGKEEQGAAKPLLKFKPPRVPRSLSHIAKSDAHKPHAFKQGKLKWGNMSPMLKEVYRSMMMNRFDTFVSGVFKSGIHDRYSIASRHLVYKRLLVMQPEENPVAFIEWVEKYITDYFAKENAQCQQSLFEPPKYLMKISKEQARNKSESDTEEESESESGLNSVHSEVEDDEEYDSESETEEESESESGLISIHSEVEDDEEEMDDSVYENRVVFIDTSPDDFPYEFDCDVDL